MAERRAVTTAWGWLQKQILVRKAALRFCARVTIAAILAFTLMQFWSLPLRGLWAVLTAVVVMQTSVGASLRATTEYVIGTLFGAVYASALGLIPHTTTPAMIGVLAIAVAPLAYLAALSPMFRVAPFTAILVLILAGQFAESPLASALIRFGEVVLGGAVATLVSIFVFPERAHGLGLTAAQRALNLLADGLPALLRGFIQPMTLDEIGAIQDSVGQSVTAFQAVIDERQHEELIGVAAKPDPGPFSRTLLRMRHDLVILGRAAATPLPRDLQERLEPHLAFIGTTARSELQACAAALAARKPPPSNAGFEAAIDAFAGEFADLRREDLIRPLSVGEAEQLFALRFGLEQLRQNFRDLIRAITEWSQASQ
jgi:uncharacterized membrane protein YccC